MKLQGNIIVLFSILAFHFVSFSQRDLAPRKGSKRSKIFGARDFRDLRNYGLQVSAGATYQFTKTLNETVRLEENGRPMDYTIDPSGKLGVFFDVGTAHFPITAPRLTFIKKRFISYYDWGKEKSDMNYYDATGTNVISEGHGEGSFYNGFASGRFTIHKNIYFGEKYFMDNGLGVNLDYRVLTGYQDYLGTKSPAPQSFSKPLVSQLHFDLGFGIRKKRGSYIIPGIQIPIVGIVGGRKTQWYSSEYWPILFKVKYVMLFEKKKSKTSCNEGSEEDRKRNKEYMQGQ
jgi:hypothetical protein